MNATITPARQRSATMPLAGRWAPSVPAVIFICLALFVPLAAQNHLLSGDGDVARHLRHGLYMLQHHTLIRADPFSFTRPGQPFVAFEYGSQLIYALAYLGGGLAGVALFAGFLIAATYGMLARFLLRKGVDPLLAMLTTIAAAVLGSVHWVARPHLISWLAIVLLLGVIESDRRRPVWMYALFFAIWANLHGGWLYGIAVLGIYVVGNIAEYYCCGRQQEAIGAARYFALALVAASVATLATPMGIELWKHLRSTFDSYIMDHTREFMSPDFHPPGGEVMLALLLGPVGALIASKRRMRMTHLALVMAGLWWSLMYRRNIPLFGLTGFAVIAMHLDLEWRRLPSKWMEHRRQGFASGAENSNTAAWVLVCCAVLVVLGVGRGSIAGSQVITTEFDSSRFPIEAVKRLDADHFRGRIFANFGWGGYLVFARPQDSVFMDGGTDFYGPELMREHERVVGLAPGWRGILDHWKIDAVLAGSNSRLAEEIVRTPGWSLWYCDSVATITRRGPRLASVSLAAAEQQLSDCVGPGRNRQD